MSKEKEINLLRELVKLDGYFAEFFGKDLDQMIQNIQHDYPIELDTNFNKAAELQELKGREQAVQHKQKCYSLFDTMLVVADETGNRRLKERVIEEIGLSEVVKQKRLIGLEWDAEDKDYLYSLL